MLKQPLDVGSMTHVSGITPRAARAALWVIAALLGVAVATVVLFGDLDEAQDQRDDLDLFLTATSDGWVEASNEFFRSPVAAARLINEGMGEPNEPVSLQNLLAAVRLDHDIDGAFIGRPDGSFQFAAHDDGDGFRTRTITPTATGTDVELRWFDADLEFVAQEVSTQSGEDIYDPRARPWYQPIADGVDEAWSDPYTFASSGQPGITFSTAMRDVDGSLSGVIGIDVRLSALDEFLSKLRPGANGQAALFDYDGNLIAISPAEAGVDLDVPMTDGAETTIFDLGSDRTAAARSFGASNEWMLVAIADDDDFVSADTSALALLARWLIVAVPVALAAATLLRPLDRWFQRLYRTATRDPLTGLASRAAITEDLHRAIVRSDTDLAVAIVDLDGFKPVNDTWGHQHGDATLEQVGRRVQRVADRHGLRAGRLGGDEFLLFRTDVGVDGADAAWSDLVAAIRRPVHLVDTQVQIGASVGVSHVEAGEGSAVEDVLRRCDRALYAVKERGGSSWLRVDGALPPTGIDLSEHERDRTWASLS